MTNEADKQSRNIGELSVKVSVDVSEALIGLKALQRKARKATQALKELDEARNSSRLVVSADLLHNIYTHYGISPTEVMTLSDDEVVQMAEQIAELQRKASERR